MAEAFKVGANARQCRCICKKQHKALSVSVSQNTRPAEIMPWA